MMEEGSKKFLFDKEIVLKQPCLSVCLLPLNFNKIVCLFRSPGGYTRAHLQVRIGPCRMCELPLGVAVKCLTYFSPRRGCARGSTSLEVLQSTFRGFLPRTRASQGNLAVLPASKEAESPSNLILLETFNYWVALGQYFQNFGKGKKI